jgi:nucleolar protein 9
VQLYGVDAFRLTNLVFSFLHLVQHRFASHCCEALFIQGASVVTSELSARHGKLETDEHSPSMEELYLQTIQELDEYLGYLMTDRFASHTLRVLLVVLSGQSLEQSASKSVVQSRRKEHVSVTTERKSDLALEARKVPESFTGALSNLISKCVADLDTTYIRALANHPTGNPTIQLLLQLELTQFGKQKAKDEKSIIHKLLPDDPLTEETDSGKFINGMLYDPVGSRLLETIIEFAPGKTFKSIYRNFFRQKLGTLAGSDVASYVVGKILNRLSGDDLADAVETFCPQIPTLVERNRTAVIKTLIERCVVRGLDTKSIATALEAAYGGPGSFEITNLLKLNKSSPMDAPISAGASSKEAGSSRLAQAPSQNSPEKLHGSLLAQAMITSEGPLSTLIYDSLSHLGPALSLSLAKDSCASRTIQAALVSPTASIIFRRKMIQQFYGHIGEMALDPSASRVIDAVWHGTNGLAFIRERIAEELAENEAAMRESFVGRAVWRNWRMDLYKRKRRDWVVESRESAGQAEFVGFPEADKMKSGEDSIDAIGKEKSAIGIAANGGRQLTGIEKARLKHAQAKLEKAEKERRDGERRERRDREAEKHGETDGNEKKERKKKSKGKRKEVKTGANAVAVS